MAKRNQETQKTVETKESKLTESKLTELKETELKETELKETELKETELKETDISLKEIERIGLGKRNMTNESIRATKRKKRKKKFLGITGAILIISLAGGTYWYTQIRETESEVESSVDIQVGDGQELVLGQITRINGNEMTFVLVEETEVTNERGSMNQTGNAAVTYTALDEERTMTIPVGTQVVTKLGTVTTFSRLASSDVMKILTEKSGDEDVILKIWIVG